MNAWVLIGLVTWLAAGVAQGAWYHFTWTNGFANGGTIPDGNPTGWWDTRTVTLPEPQILEVKVTLEISGGFNGDLYGYLTHGSGFAVLLNRPGKTAGDLFGYSDAGLHVTFSDSAVETTDFHFYQTVGAYNIAGGAEWRPDGRAVDPATVNGTESRTALLASFVGPNAPGEWKLFLADLSLGQEHALVQWGVSINAVPEPTSWALAIFGALLVRACRRPRLGPMPKQTPI